MPSNRQGKHPPASGSGEGAELDKVRVTIRMPLQPEGEARYANHVIASLNGSEFILTFAQVLRPPIADQAELRAALAGGVIDARVVQQIVMPVDKFTEFIDNVAKLVDGLRKHGALPAASTEEKE